MKFKQKLIFAGFLLFFIGLITGVLIPVVKVPRLGLSSHLGALMNGTFLIALGLCWTYVKLSTRSSKIVYGLAIYGSFMNWVAGFLGAMMGTSDLTPIAGEGYVGTPVQELITSILLTTVALSLLAACVMILIGLKNGMKEV